MNKRQNDSLALLNHSAADTLPSNFHNCFYKQKTSIYFLQYVLFCCLLFGVSGGLFYYLSDSSIQCIIEYSDPEKVCDDEIECASSYILELNKTHCFNKGKTLLQQEKTLLQPPVYLYYRLTNYYQNIMPYWRSRNDQQLKGKIVTKINELKSCYPEIYGRNNRILLPCGAVARSIFNDTYTLLVPNRTLDESYETLIKQSRIWDYKHPNKTELNPDMFDDWLSKTIFPGGIKNPHFIIWMQTSISSELNKLYGVIHQTLELPIPILVHSRYPVKLYNGRKLIVLDTHTNFVGSYYSFFYVLYLFISIFSLTAFLCLLI